MGPLDDRTICRRYARYVIISLVLGIVCWVLKWNPPQELLLWLRPHQRELFGDILHFAGSVLLISGLFVWRHNLRCPYCGMGFVMPWWSGTERHYCSRCGKEIVFDDTPPSH